MMATFPRPITGSWTGGRHTRCCLFLVRAIQRGLHNRFVLNLCVDEGDRMVKQNLCAEEDISRRRVKTPLGGGDYDGRYRKCLQKYLP